MPKKALNFHTLSEQARRFEISSMFWLMIDRQGYVTPDQWGRAQIYAADPSTCPFVLPELQDNLDFLTTSDDFVNVQFATIEAKEACRWLAQCAYEERNSRFMERFYSICAMTDKPKRKLP